MSVEVKDFLVSRTGEDEFPFPAKFFLRSRAAASSTPLFLLSAAGDLEVDCA
jgi:hypothetical protein